MWRVSHIQIFQNLPILKKIKQHNLLSLYFFNFNDPFRLYIALFSSSKPLISPRVSIGAEKHVWYQDPCSEHTQESFKLHSVLNYTGKRLCGQGHFFLLFLLCGLGKGLFRWGLGCYSMLVVWNVWLDSLVEKYTMCELSIKTDQLYNWQDQQKCAAFQIWHLYVDFYVCHIYHS